MNEGIELNKAYKIKESCHIKITENITQENLLLMIHGYYIVKITLMGANNEGEIIQAANVFLYESNGTVFVPINKKHL